MPKLLKKHQWWIQKPWWILQRK